MKKTIKRLIGFIALLAVIGVSGPLISCQQPVEPGNEQQPAPDGRLVVLGISELSEGAWDYLVIGNDGSSFYYSVDESDGILPTKVYYKPKKDSDAGFTIFFKENGLLPDIMEYNGYIVKFANFNGYQFDMAIIYPNGEIDYQFGVETDMSFDDVYGTRSVSRNLIRPGRSIGGRYIIEDILEADTPLKKASVGLDIVSHGIGIGTCIAGLAFPPFLVGCAFYTVGTAVEVWADFLLKESEWQDEAGFLINYASWAIDVVQCAGSFGLSVDCVSAVVGAASVAVNGVQLYLDDDKIAALVEQAVRELYIPVTGITGVPETAAVGIPLPLSATVEPANASNRYISWSLVGSPPAAIEGGSSLNATLTATATGNVTVRATIYDGTGPGEDFTRTFTIQVLSFVTVTEITGVPTEAVIGKPLELTATVHPDNASSKTITWSVVDGPATIYRSSLTATAAGPVKVRATIPYGTGPNTDFIREFTITVGSFVAVTGISGVPDRGTVGVPLTLSGTVEPANASFQTISWSVVSDSPFVTLNGDTLNANVAGQVIVQANINNGTVLGNYFRNFTIIFSDGSGDPTVWRLVEYENNPLNDDNVFISRHAVIAYGDGKFIISSGDGSGHGKMGYSPDGVTWTRIVNSGPTMTVINDIAYGGGKFVAVGQGGPKIAYSSDGITWTPIAEDSTPFPGSSYVLSIAYGGGKFVTEGIDGGHSRFAYSSDGVTWTAVENSIIADDQAWRIAYGGGRFVAGGFTGGIAYSSDGVTWTTVADRPFDDYTDEISSIAYGDGRFVASAWDDDDGMMRLAYSSNGETWTAVTGTGISYGFTESFVAYGGGRFVAGNRENRMAYSSDGVTWTTISPYPTYLEPIFGIAYGGGRFVTVGRGNRIMYSIPE